MSNSGRFKKGNKPWNKGLDKSKNPLTGKPRSEKVKMKIKQSKGKKNYVHTKKDLEKMSKTYFKKGYKPWNKNKKCPQLSNENHWNWQGGKTILWRKIRNLKNMKIWKNSVLKRDNYVCQKCGKEFDLEAHHKLPFAAILIKNDIKTIEEAIKCKELWNINNGITLCNDCHNKIKIIRNYVNYSGDPITVYLSGYINNEKINKCIKWRQKIKEHYNTWNDGEGYPIKWLDPMNGDLGKIKDKGMSSSILPGKALVMRDFNSVRLSDLIIANLNTFGAKRSMIGTFYELAWAWEHHKPIIIITDKYYKNHPFIKDTAAIIVKDVDELLRSKYINWFFKGWVNAEY